MNRIIVAFTLFLSMMSGCMGGVVNGTVMEANSISGSRFFPTFLGGLYSRTVAPLTFNREPTEVRSSIREARGKITQIQYPLASAISIRTGKNGLGDIAREHGITTIYYADIETQSVLFGIWQKSVIRIYGR